MAPEQIKQSVKGYVLSEFLEGNAEDDLTDSTELVTLGILDSMALLKLVAFLEREFSVSFDANELDVAYFNTLPEIVEQVVKKIA